MNNKDFESQFDDSFFDVEAELNGFLADRTDTRSEKSVQKNKSTSNKKVIPESSEKIQSEVVNHDVSNPKKIEDQSEIISQSQYVKSIQQPTDSSEQLSIPVNTSDVTKHSDVASPHNIDPEVIVETPPSITDSNVTSDMENLMAPEYDKFVSVPGMFEVVGGKIPVVLNPQLKTSGVSGLFNPLMELMQKELLAYEGYSLNFPWGKYEVTHKNKVFQNNSSLMRFVQFDSMRDEHMRHIKLAKQWYLSQYPNGLDENFNVNVVKPSDDRLDIYALLLIRHVTGGAIETTENHMLDTLLEHVNDISVNLKQLQQDQKRNALLSQQSLSRMQLLDTVLLLDRMGLLNGSLPRDVGMLTKLIEDSQDVIETTDQQLMRFMLALQSKKQRLAREQAKRK